MKRRNFLTTGGIALGALSLNSVSGFASLLTADPYKIRMLTSNLGVFTEKGETIAFLIPNKGSSDGIVVVDSQYVDSAQHLIADLKKRSDLPFNTNYNK